MKGYCECKNRLEDSFYNPGGVHDTFGPVEAYIKKLMKTEIPKIPCNPKDNPNNYEKCYSFEYIKKSKFNNNSNLTLKTNEDEINTNNFSKYEEYIEINFHNSFFILFLLIIIT